jgi:hypothetical protein
MYNNIKKTETNTESASSNCSQDGRTMAQAVSHQPLTVQARVCTQVTPCGICGGLDRIETGFSLSSLAFSCQYHSTMTLHNHISSGG